MMAAGVGGFSAMAARVRLLMPWVYSIRMLVCMVWLKHTLQITLGGV